ncbi:MAG: sulfotransferase [Balneolales bacterium]
MKVFCIGLNKTGTTTLGECLRILGYKHTSFSQTLLEGVALGNSDKVIEITNLHDSFADWPYPLIYKQLDCIYNGSRFILSRRKTPETWFNSLASHSLRTDPFVGSRTRSLVYGYPYPQLNPIAHLAFYNKHLNDARSYFRNRPQDILELCWDEGSGWKDICSFLSLPVPHQDLPYSNSTRLGNMSNDKKNKNLLNWYTQLHQNTLYSCNNENPKTDSRDA